MITSKFSTRDSGLSIFRNLKFSACLLALVNISSCQKVLDIEIKTNDKRLLVDGEFTNDSIIHSIKLSCSSSLLTGVPQGIVSGASIYVTDKIDTFYYAESNITPGLYQTLIKCCGKGGVNYSLSITNIDIDKDGIMESFSAESMMPVPVKLDSLISIRGIHPMDKIPGILNNAYCKIFYNGPDFFYSYMTVNNYSVASIRDLIGTGNINRFKDWYSCKKVQEPNSTIKSEKFFFIANYETLVKENDTINYIGLNLTRLQFEFLKEFDNNTEGDPFLDNMYDQLKIPANISTNIEPSNKVAGYFFIYSVSSICKVFKE